MRTLFAIGLSVLLGGCGISNPILKSEIVSFDDVIESATDKLLVLNILRARDQAPLHFMALPSLRQAITQTNRLSLLEPTGPRLGSTLRSTATLDLSFQVGPSFDLNHLYTKEFVTGMTSPIDPKYVKYWLDRDFDRRIIMLLFFSSAEITYTSGGKPKLDRITNTPKESIDEIRNRIRSHTSGCNARSQFERYLSLINRFDSFSAKTATSQKPAACIYSDGSDGAKLLQALAAAEQSKMKFKYVKSKNVKNSGAFKLYSGSGDTQTLFCLGDKALTLDKTRTQKNAANCKEPPDPPKPDNDKDCPQYVPDASDKKDEEDIKKEEADAKLTAKAEAEKKAKEEDEAEEKAEKLALAKGETFKKRPPHCAIAVRVAEDGKTIEGVPLYDLDITFTIRSVGEMIHFLGDLLYYQEALNSDPIIRDGKVRPEQKVHDLHSPVTLGYCREELLPKGETAPPPGISDILFALSDDQANARFIVPYRDRVYGVGNYLPAPVRTLGEDASRCDAALAYRKDHTLEVLSVVQALTNLHQSATEIRSTPTVQVVP
jgi:hypothetical protein